MGNNWSFACRGGFTESDAQTIAKTYYCNHENLTEDYFNKNYYTSIDSTNMYYAYNVVIRESSTTYAVAQYKVHAAGRFNIEPY